MTHNSLGSRQKSYEKPSDYTLMARLPLIIRLNGKNFTKLTKNLNKPYDSDFAKIMANALLYTITDIQGAIFGFTGFDEVTIVLRNDQSLDTEPWLNNRIQKISSIVASSFTIAFYKHCLIAEKEAELEGDPIFDARIFSVPSLSEVANNLIWRQNEIYKKAIVSTSHFELAKKLGNKRSYPLLEGKSLEERKDLLLKFCGINFEDFYPASFYHGVAVYRVPILFNESEEIVTKNKWKQNWQLPAFQFEKSFIQNIIVNGKDIIRPEKED